MNLLMWIVLYQLDKRHFLMYVRGVGLFVCNNVANDVLITIIVFVVEIRIGQWRFLFRSLHIVHLKIIFLPEFLRPFLDMRRFRIYEIRFDEGRCQYYAPNSVIFFAFDLQIFCRFSVIYVCIKVCILNFRINKFYWLL